MSDERQETISDIVADIRAQNQGLPEGSYALSPLVCDLLSIADRIEAAAKREREAGADDDCHQPVTDCHGLNTAAMREALEAAIPIMRACLFDYYNTTDVNKVVGEMKAALSAPPRNCDAFSKDKVLEMLKDRSFSKEDTIEWLFDEAKGETK